MQDKLNAFVIVSSAYIASSGLVFLIVDPIQADLLPESYNLASIIFLPHGVRVLAFFFLGASAFFYLLPAKIFMWATGVYLFHMSALNFWGSIVSLLSCLFALMATRHLFRFQAGTKPRFSWQMILRMGSISSLLNSIGLTVLQSTTPTPSLIALYFIGDVTGLVALMIALMFYFRYQRQS